MEKLKLKWFEFVNEFSRIEWIIMITLFLGVVVIDLVYNLLEAPTHGVFTMLCGVACLIWMSARTNKLDLNDPSTFPESGGLVYYMMEMKEQEEKEKTRLERMRALYPHSYNKGNPLH